MQAAPTFQVVMAVPPGGDSFRVFGVFSRRPDADELVAALDASPAVAVGACVDELTFDQLADEIYKDRLGKLTPLIKALEASVAASLTLPVEAVAQLQMDLAFPGERRG